MAPLKRLRKASDKSTEATTVTEAAATKKSREVEESSNALQTANLGYSSAKFTEASAKLAREPSCYIRIPSPKVHGQFGRGCPLVIYGYPSAKCAEESANLAEGAFLLYTDTPRPNLPRHRQI
ncbi:hypothetical protein FNV43_RR13435 [Rhamnella rubrinervis]|uniref:Uncharacterized protein n=1 Tax=Rhamnella rubrinervis TaxID=2594499 RepID=A0A8K0H186_9ROSA|nr:hypothetical protein FNV43_RR13435 [Rhamnella rubrinervis]